METAVIRLDASDPTPIYAQIDRGIRAAVATGRWAIGVQLPTVRQLAIQLKVNANTVAKVYSDLERQGLVETRRGIGTFVADSSHLQAQRLPNRQALRDFAVRILEDAAARGFSREELIVQLQRQLKEDTHA